MGFSTPKPPFDLADFLSQKGTPRSRRPTWKRAPGKVAPAVTADAVADDQPDSATEE